jgi:hypothetical protein
MRLIDQSINQRITESEEERRSEVKEALRGDMTGVSRR